MHQERNAQVAVVYAAKSTEDTSDSLGSQLDRCREHATQQGWTVSAEFQEKAVSAYKQSRGPQLAAAKQTAAQLAADGHDVMLLVFASDRLARGDGVQAMQLVEHYLEAKKAGYALASVTEQLDNIVMVALLGERAHVDSAAKGEHVSRGKKHAAQQGRRSGGGRPYGYEYAIVGTNRATRKVVTELVPHKTEAPNVRRIYREYVKGTSQAAIARGLGRDGVENDARR